jgi:hypothetical protein
LESQVRVHVRQLKAVRDELAGALYTIVDMAPPEAEPVLRAHRYPKSREQLDEWRSSIAHAALGVARPQSGRQLGDILYWAERAYCPLCRGSKIDWAARGDTGFAYPDGLMRHLRGTYNSKRCRVVDAALRLAELNLERAAAEITADLPG